MKNGPGWDEDCHPAMLKAHTQPCTSEEPLPWATFHAKAWSPDAKLQSGPPSAMVPIGPPRLQPCARVPSVVSWGLPAVGTHGLVDPLLPNPRPQQGLQNSELQMSRHCMCLHWRGDFHHLGLCEVSLIHISYTEDKLLPSHTQP